MIVRGCVFFVFFILASTSSASDLARELDYAATLQRTLNREQIVWLNAGEQRFLGLFIEAEKTDGTNAVIVLHDKGEQPDQFPLIHGLRTILPQHGWNSLAVQLPLREIGADVADYYPLFDEGHQRIRAAVEYLRTVQGAQNIAIIGHGVGAAMAVYGVSLDSDGLQALVAISLSMPESRLPQAQVGEFIPKIALPFLDLYAEFDLPEVADTARQRRMLAKDNPVFRQIKITGENHAYLYDPGMLIKRVYSWLALTLNTN